MASDALELKVEFTGGLELLFDNKKKYTVSLPRTMDDAPTNLTHLILWLKDNLLKERPELFIEERTVRPGILVLVNETDWELEGEGDYQLKDGDEIIFISTLHGG
ncbi:ubiquitin-related modifier 1 [Exidia glandulosa HHB12029]|uniref:Ubiquitin-related modifier 1 n=1 Tax=Exidia glandulosa HHB12029 TaxID=1314781 RepID=A0A166NHW4_EXIGL|nr:ubiquitin-related modifier 1 [Exidia glandulosa HHB12029]